MRGERAEMNIINIIAHSRCSGVMNHAPATPRQFLDPLATGPYEKLKPLEYHIYWGLVG